MAANQNPQQQAPQQQGQQPQAPQQGQQYGYPPPGYYPPPQYACPPPAAPKDEGMGLWTALGLVGAGFLLGQLFAEPTPQQQMPPPQPGLKMPWQK